MCVEGDLLDERWVYVKSPIRIAINLHRSEMGWVVMGDVEGADFGTEHVKGR